MNALSPRNWPTAAAFVAAVFVCCAQGAEWTDLLPSGAADESVRGYVRPPATLCPSASASQPLSLPAAGNRRLVRTQWTLFQPAEWKREGRTVGRVSVETGLLDVVTPIGGGDDWWVAWRHRDQDVDAFLSRPSYRTRGAGDGGGDSWAVGYRGDSGWRIGLGWSGADGDLGTRWEDDGEQVVEGGIRTSRDTLRMGVAREAPRHGWSLEWERGRVGDALAFARNGAEAYSLGLSGDEDVWAFSAWRVGPHRDTWVQIRRGRATTAGPLAVAGWERGSASGLSDCWAASVGRHTETGAGRETWVSMEWVDSDRDVRGVALGGVLPGVGNRGRGAAAVGGRGVAAKYAERRPLSGGLGLVTGLGLAQVSSGTSYLLEEASGLLGSFAPTHRRWYGANLTALGLTVGLDRRTRDDQLALSATYYVGRFDSHGGSVDYPLVPPGPPGPPGPAAPATRFNKAFHVGLMWERRF